MATELTDNDTSFLIRPRSTSPRNIHEYPLTIATAFQFGITIRAVCALGNAILTDLSKIYLYIFFLLLKV